MRTRPRSHGLLPCAFLLRLLAAVCRNLPPARGGSSSLRLSLGPGDRLALLLSLSEQEGKP